MSVGTYRKAIATQGLLDHATAPEPEGTPLTDEQRDEAMRQYRIDVASQLPLEELLDIVARRFDKDQAFRTRVRDISRNRGKPDKPGRRGKLSQAQTYWEVQKQRHSSLLLKHAVEVVAKFYGKPLSTVRRQYEAEVSRIKKAISAKKRNTG